MAGDAGRDLWRESAEERCALLLRPFEDVLPAHARPAPAFQRDIAPTVLDLLGIGCREYEGVAGGPCFRASQPAVFAAGNCLCGMLSADEAAWESGLAAGAIARWLEGKLPPAREARAPGRASAWLRLPRPHSRKLPRHHSRLPPAARATSTTEFL